MPTGIGQPVMLSPGNNISKCPGDEVTLTCKVPAGHLIWISNEYIGIDGQQLEFWPHDSLGEQKMSNIDSNVVATLVNIRDSAVESQLRITVKKSGIIICKDGTSGSSNNSTVYMISKSIPEINFDGSLICSLSIL